MGTGLAPTGTGRSPHLLNGGGDGGWGPCPMETREILNKWNYLNALLFIYTLKKKKTLVIFFSDPLTLCAILHFFSSPLASFFSSTLNHCHSRHWRPPTYSYCLLLSPIAFVQLPSATTLNIANNSASFIA